MILYSPLFFLLNGLWMISNRQIFESVVNKIPNIVTVMPSSHTIMSVLDRP